MTQNSLIDHIDLLSGSAVALLCVCMAVFASGCSYANQPRAQGESDEGEIPPRIQQWMDSLTVAHTYDPQTGFIVAREVIDLPPVLRDGPTLTEAVARSMDTNQLVVVFATADRCAPCQQFKKDALNDVAVIERLKRGDLIVVHVEVDRMCDESAAILGSRMIPMSYLIDEGKVIDTLGGQRSAAALLQWLREAEQRGANPQAG